MLTTRFLDIAQSKKCQHLKLSALFSEPTDVTNDARVKELFKVQIKPLDLNVRE